MPYYVYILRSTVKRRFYIGCTGDIKQRLAEHNAGKTKSTRPYRPWKLIYRELFNDKSQAFKREWYLKHPEGYQDKLLIIHNYGEIA